ncbi:MAG: hypothetical protein ACLFV7_08425 [Phycisphaerae bacterium]
MSLGGFLGGYHAARALDEAVENMGTASRDVRERRQEAAAVSISALNDRVDKLSLVCLAMWSLLQEKTALSEEDLMERVRLIDLADGVPDGKVTRTVRQCTRCGRTMSPRHRKCLYCGTEDLKESAFDDIAG